MRIICVMPIYKRPNITLATIELLNKQTLPFHKILTIGSCNMDRKTAKKAGVDYIQYENYPLGAKWQYGVDYAKYYNPDAILTTGSDSWLTTNWCEVMSPYIEKGYHLVGKKLWYKCKVNPGEKIKILQRKQLTRKDPIGAGRLFSKQAMNLISWNLYPDELNNSLDGSSYQNLLTAAKDKNIKLKVKIIDNREDVFSLGIKSSTWPSKNPWIMKRTSSRFDTKRIHNPERWVERAFPGALEVFKSLVPGVVI